MKLIHKLVTGFLSVAVLIWVTGYFAVSLSKEELEKAFIYTAISLVEEILDDIDRNIHSKIEIFRAYSQDEILQAAVRNSNQDFEKLNDIHSYINERDQEWISAQKNKVTPFMENLINNELSNELRKKIEFFEGPYGDRVYGEVFITNKYGATVAQTGKTSDYRQDDEEWWQAAKRDGLYIRDVEYDESADVYSVDIGIRVADENDDFIGVMKVVLNIEEVISILKSKQSRGTHSEHKSMKLRLITRDGKLIYSNQEGEELFKDVSYLLPTTGHLNPDNDHMGGTFIFKSNRDGYGKDLIVLARSKGYGEYEGLGWIILLSHSVDEIFAPVTELKNRILTVSLFVTILAVLMGFLLSNSIAKRVKKLRDAAEKIGKGDLNTTIDVKSGDEIGELAGAFRQMTEDLRTANTARNKLSKEIKESEEKYRALFEAAGDAIFTVKITDNGPVFKDCNPQALEMFRCSYEEIINKSPLQFSPPFQSDGKSSEEKILGIMQEVMKGTAYSFEWTYIRADEEQFDAEVSLNGVEIGNKSYLLAVVRDITMRKQVEEALRLSEEYFRSFVESSRDCMAHISLNGEYMSMNPAGYELYDIDDPEEITNMKCTDNVLENREALVQAIKRAAQGENISVQYKNISKKGREIWWDSSLSPVLDIDGTIKNVLMVSRDVTERRQMQQALEQMNEELGRSNNELQQFAYIASHDLQEPLRKIKTFGNRLNDKFSNVIGDQGKDYIARMQNAADRMNILIDGLLKYSQVTTGAQPFEPVDLDKVAREVISDLEIRIEQTGGTVEVTNLPTINADPLQMRQLLQNLIGNALKFNKKNAPPVVKVYGSTISGSGENAGINESCQIIVEDNGIGFDEKNVDRIFSIFQRLRSRSEYEGTGIGLSICKKIVERHGGNITAKSNPGGGATFTVSLPVKPIKGESTNV